MHIKTISHWPKKSFLIAVCIYWKTAHLPLGQKQMKTLFLYSCTPTFFFFLYCWQFHFFSKFDLGPWLEGNNVCRIIFSHCNSRGSISPNPCIFVCLSVSQSVHMSTLPIYLLLALSLGGLREIALASKIKTLWHPMPDSNPVSFSGLGWKNVPPFQLQGKWEGELVKENMGS